MADRSDWRQEAGGRMKMKATILRTTPLGRAVLAAGSQSALARKIGLTQQHVWNWLYRMGQVPAEYVIRIEKATGISRHELRPDIYPIEETTK